MQCEKTDGDKVYLEVEAVESIEEHVDPQLGLIAEVVMAGGLHHLVKDDPRHTGLGWIQLKRAVREAKREG